TDLRIGVGVAPKLHNDLGQGSARLHLPEHARINLFRRGRSGRLPGHFQQRALDEHLLRKVTWSVVLKEKELSAVMSGAMSGVKISALGCYVPPGILSNHDLEKMVETSDEWILQRVGISERHIATPDVATSDMAVKAARAALEQRGIEAGELDAILVCT